MSLRIQRQNVAAFTLIELLVVVAIIAVLVAILLPAMASARSVARQAACAGRMQQMGQGLGVYLNENNDFLPPAVMTDASSVAWGTAWQQELAKCMQMDPTCGPANMPQGEFWLCPESTGTHSERPWANWYAYNSLLYSLEKNMTIPVQITSFPQPSNVIGITDAWNHLDIGTNCTWVPWFGSSDPRHNLKCNLLWLDFHVSLQPKDEFTFDGPAWFGING